MSFNKAVKTFFTTSSFVVIPFIQPDWNLLKYSSLPSNELEFSKKSMTLHVDKSASPVIYKLPKPIVIKELSVEGEILGNINFNGRVQGESKADDFSVRVGLVIEGKRKLNAFQRFASPKWVKELYALSDSDTGIDKINFYNVSHRPLSWKEREHPLSELLNEYIVQNAATGKFSFSHKVEDGKRVIAIWLSSDGDDTGSTYSVRFDKIELKQ